MPDQVSRGVRGSTATSDGFTHEGMRTYRGPAGLHGDAQAVVRGGVGRTRWARQRHVRPDSGARGGDGPAAEPEATMLGR